MPLPGGPSDKIGNRYELWWTVSQLVRIINGQAENIRIEDLAVDKAEFVITAGGYREFHQANGVYPNLEVLTINYYRRCSSSFLKAPTHDSFLYRAVMLQS